MEKASFLLQNLKFRRSKKAVVVKRAKSPSGSEIFHSFENIELDDVDKASIRSADLQLDSDCSSESGEEVAVAREKPQEAVLKMKDILKSFLAPEENPSALKQKEINGDFAPKSVERVCERGDSFSTAADSWCQSF